MTDGQIKWKVDADIRGWTGEIGTQWVLGIYPHAKDGWSWTVITDNADQNVPRGWDPTLEDAMVHSESAYLDWRDIIEGRKAVPDEHDETACGDVADLLRAKADVELSSGSDAGYYALCAAAWSVETRLPSTFEARLAPQEGRMISGSKSKLQFFATDGSLWETCSCDHPEAKSFGPKGCARRIPEGPSWSEASIAGRIGVFGDWDTLEEMP